MPVDPVAAPVATGMYTSKPTREPKQEMDNEVFMNLLVTQLRNQDPSNALSTNEMVAQTTQMAMMESLVGLKHSVEEMFGVQMRTNAAELLGNQVSYIDDDGAEHSGTATAVSYAGPVPTVTVGGVEVLLDSVSGITTPTASTDAPATTPRTTDGAPSGTGDAVVGA